MTRMVCSDRGRAWRCAVGACVALLAGIGPLGVQSLGAGSAAADNSRGDSSGATVGDVSAPWTAVCEPPTGRGYEYGDLESVGGDVLRRPDQGFGEMSDSFSNVNPSFFYPGSGTGYIQVLWGSTRPDGVSPEAFETPDAATARVMQSTPERIVTVLRMGGETWMTTHFPGTGIAYATRHQRTGYADLGYMTSATTFAMRCHYEAVGTR